MTPMPNQPSGSPAGAFEEQVLVAVLRVRGESYGMEIRRELERVTDREIAIGAVYATLDRLEEKGWLRSNRAGFEGGASRRIFEVTKAGARVLAETRELHARLWHGVRLPSFP